MVTDQHSAAQSNKPIWLFIFFWMVLNLLQAATLEVHADEAYYWMYSRLPAWGYFDHPPMVAMFIRLGYALLHNELGLRLITVLSSSVAIYVMWLIVKHYRVPAKSFILVMSGIFVFHIYGFTTTPDSPLLLFTVLFLYCYRKYLMEDSWSIAILLAIIIACLLYSKYHGVLLIGLTVIANPKLLQRKTFWAVVVLSVLLYVPHIVWQAQHGYPSVNYHLSERSAEKYNFAYSYEYPISQLVVAGPLIGWFVFWTGFRLKVKDAFTRTLLFNAIGILLFFFATSFKGEVQPHWTLIAYVPLAMLMLINLSASRPAPSWFAKLAVANIMLIVAVRLCIMSGAPFVKQVGAIKSYFGFHEWADAIHQKAGDNYVIFNEGFQNPSKYNFYNNTLKGFAYDSRFYRRTQYDIWPIEDGMQGKRAYYVLQYRDPTVTTDSILTSAGTWYGGWVNNVRTYQRIDMKVPSYKITAHPGEKKTFDLSFTNPYPFPISFANLPGQHPVTFEACFFDVAKLVETQPVEESFYSIKLQPGQHTRFKFTVTAPAQKGRYDLFFSLRTEPFPGAKNNRLINFIVE